MREIEDNKERTTLAMAVARMWRDPEYKRQFISDPKSVLRSEGVSFSEHTVVKVVEETPTTKYIDLRDDEQSAPDAVARLLPLAEGQELRIVQSTDSLRYLVLPAAPGWISPGVSANDGFLKLSTEQPPLEVISETTLVEAQLVTAESVAIEQTTQATVSAEELIVESAVVVESANQTVQEVQVIEVTAEFEVETTIGAAAVQYIA